MLSILPEKDRDQKAIFEVNLQAFGREVEPRLVDDLRRSENWVDGLSLVAGKDGVVLGHILFTKLSIEPYKHDFAALLLAPLAVVPEYQGQGIGTKLVNEGLKVCLSMDYKNIIVIGHPEYYPRFGFAPARDKGLESSITVLYEAFMVLELVPGSLNGIEGMVIFPEEFCSF